MTKFKWSGYKKPIFGLSPMAEITTSAYRRICKEMGADLVYAPMISSNAVIHNSEKTWKMMNFQKTERPIIVQIFGYDGKILTNAANLIHKELHPDGIDLNLGCPAPKITGNECGSALLKDLNKTLEIIKIVRENYKGQLSVKIRLGWNKLEVLHFCKELEKIGIDAIAIHGRTAKQKYKGLADWQPIYEIAKNIKIPVLGNGDINTWQQAYKRLDKSNLAGVLIGRGALGNPWIFQEIKKKKTINIDIEQRKNILLQHTKLYIDEVGDEKRAILEMRKHFGWYIKGFNGASDIRKKLMQVNNLQELTNILSENLI
ncbi:tRNA dihydrouridine synthase [Patescibacteria group bacterium]